MKTTWLFDFVTGKEVSKYYDLYKQTERYDVDEMKSYQLYKFKRLVDHCYKNVPFYREYMTNNGINPSDIVALEDIERFPIITKEIIKDNYQKFTPDNLSSIVGVKTSQR